MSYQVVLHLSLALCCICSITREVFAQSVTGVTGVRLAGSTYGSHLGRVEVQYNNNDTWGGVCSTGWNYNSARVACRSAGFLTVVCPATLPQSQSRDSPATPVWLGNIRCRGGEPSLSRCRHRVRVQDCTRVAAAVCADRSIVGQTTALRVVENSPYSVRLNWKLPAIPEGVVRLRWVVARSWGPNVYFYSNNVNLTRFAGRLSSLNPNSNYSVRVRTDVRYSLCNGWLWGNYSDSFTFTTPTPATSQYAVRLVSPWPQLQFLGRVEVQYNSTWGTVCQDGFSWDEANVMCRMLGYQRSRCFLYQARYGPGTGPIWLDNLNCGPSDSILEDCNNRGWGVHNCNHRKDVGVICHPNDDDEFVQPVSGLQVVSVNSNSISLSWEAFTFPPGVNLARYVIRYNRTRPQRSQVAYVSRQTQFTIRRLPLNVNYVITVSAQYRFSYCRFIFSAQPSAAVTARTIEKAPSGPPTSIHIVPRNSTAIEFHWNLPLINLRNGRIRGFKVFYRQIDQQEDNVVTVRNSRATELVVGGLQPGTYYTFSVLAFTIADGVKSSYLTAPTYDANYTQLIISFGPDGNGEDHVVMSSSQRNLEIHCGSGIYNATMKWLYSNNSLISSTDRQFRQITDSRNVAVLQVGNGRLLEECDAGVYVCEATAFLNGVVVVQTRNFTLLIDDSPPVPGIPYLISARSTQITVGWDESECDGGHNITELAIRYHDVEANPIAVSYDYIYNIDASRRRYTVLNLEPETSYAFAVQAISAEYSESDFSDERIISTLFAAPSAPLDVEVRLIKSPIVEVTWKEPADHYGIIKTYIIYAMAPNVSLSVSQDSVQQTSFEKSVNVSGHIGAANITVVGSHSEVQFQVSAVIVVDDVEIEGEKSEITSESTVFVPVANLPVPGNVRVVSTTNTSATLSWSYPSLAFHVPFQSFLISYRGRVNWRSPDSYLVQFRDTGSISVPSSSTSVVIRSLIPSTSYTFSVSVVTASYGNGRPILTMGRTKIPIGNRLAYFQLKLYTPNCFSLKLDSKFLAGVQTSLLRTFNNTLCNSLQAQCELSLNSVNTLSLTCGNSLMDSVQAIIQGRVMGGNAISADNMIDLLEVWVKSNTAMITASGLSLSVAQDCPVAIDHISSMPSCLSVQTTTAPTGSSTTVIVASPKTSRTNTGIIKTITTKSVPISTATQEAAVLPGTGSKNEPSILRSTGSNEVPIAVMGVIFCIVIVILIAIVVILMVVIVRMHRNYGRPIAVSWRKSSDETGLVNKDDTPFGEEFGTRELDDK